MATLSPVDVRIVRCPVCQRELDVKSVPVQIHRADGGGVLGDAGSDRLELVLFARRQALPHPDVGLLP